MGLNLSPQDTFGNIWKHLETFLVFTAWGEVVVLLASRE